MKSKRTQFAVSGVVVSCLLGIGACGKQEAVSARASAPSAVAAGSESAPSTRATDTVRTPAPATVTLHGSSAYRFLNVAEMVATSDAVIEGEVLTVAPGDTVPGGYINRYSTVRVLSRLSGNPPDTLTVSEWGWDGAGNRVIMDGWPGLQVGNRAILFLRRDVTPNGPIYTPIGSAATFLVTGENAQVASGDADDPGADQLRRLTPSKVRSAIVAAKSLVALKRMAPNRPGQNLEGDPNTTPSAPYSSTKPPLPSSGP